MSAPWSDYLAVLRCLAWCVRCRWTDEVEFLGTGFCCPNCGAPAMPPRNIFVRQFPRLLTDCQHQKNGHNSFGDRVQWGAFVTLTWDFEEEVFAGKLPLLILDFAPGMAWVNSNEDEWQMVITFEATRVSWRAAWDLTRRLTGATPARPALLPHDLLADIVSITHGPRVANHYRCV